MSCSKGVKKEIWPPVWVSTLGRPVPCKGWRETEIPVGFVERRLTNISLQTHHPQRRCPKVRLFNKDIEGGQATLSELLQGIRPQERSAEERGPLAKKSRKEASTITARQKMGSKRCRRYGRIWAHDMYILNRIYLKRKCRNWSDFHVREWKQMLLLGSISLIDQSVLLRKRVFGGKRIMDRPEESLLNCYIPILMNLPQCRS